MMYVHGIFSICFIFFCGVRFLSFFFSSETYGQKQLCIVDEKYDNKILKSLILTQLFTVKNINMVQCWMEP